MGRTSPEPGTPITASDFAHPSMPPSLGGSRLSMSRPTAFATPGANLISSLRQDTSAQAIRRQLAPVSRARFASTTTQSVRAPAPAPTSAPAPAPTSSAPAAPMIDGQLVNVHPAPVLEFNKQQIVRMYDKEKRATMQAEDLASYIEKATKRIVHPKKLLRMPTYTTEGSQMLRDLVEAKLTLDNMVEHMRLYDLMDGLTVVVPLDIYVHPSIGPKTYDLFQDYPLLTLDMVKLSTLYYRMWASDSYVGSSMNLQVKFLQSNCDADLTNKILLDAETLPIPCQTGPCMFFIMLRRLYNCSESVLDQVLSSAKSLKISEIEGEDVDEVIRTISAATGLLLHSSNQTRTYITHDFSRDVLRIFQTSTLSEFNSIFLELERRCQVEADSNGESIVSWPTVDSIIQLASATYARLHRSGKWCKSVKPAAFPAVAQAGWTPGDCFNCGKNDHMLPDCPLPSNQTTIDANKQAMLEYRKLHPKKNTNSNSRSSGRGGGSGRGRGHSHGQGSGGGSSKPHRKVASDGKPLKLNNHGLYVLDTKKWATMRQERQIDKITALLANGVPGTAPAAVAPAAAPAAPAANTAAGPPATPASTGRADEIRAVVARCFE